MICPACSVVNTSEAEECFGCGKALFALTLGRVLADRYEIQRPLGQGGMGKVYEAWDRVLEDRVAVKVLRPQFAREPEMARRFLLEIRLARRITHPNVCRLHEYGESAGIRYLCMELVDGVNLKDLLRERRFSPDEAYEVALAAALGLEAVHAQGVIHRDFKTANIMLDGRGQVKVMDFGIAKDAGADTTGMSLAGHVLGTPEYMSPEQVQGARVDFRSDIYALGCVIFEVFAGRALFQGASPIDTLRRQLHEPVGFSNEQGLLVPEPLVPVLARALAKKPDQRYASVTDLAADLRAARAGVTLPSQAADDGPLSDLLEVPPAVSGPPLHGPIAVPVTRGPWLVRAGLVVALGAGAFAWWRGVPPPPDDPARERLITGPPTSAAPETVPVSRSRAADEASPAPPTRAPSRAAPRDEARGAHRPSLTAVAAAGEAPASIPPSAAPSPPPPQLTSPASAPAEEVGVLNLLILPPSVVEIDDSPVGTVSSRAFRLSPGPHAIRVLSDKYDPYNRKVTVRARAVIDVVIDLSEKGVPRKAQ